MPQTYKTIGMFLSKKLVFFAICMVIEKVMSQDSSSLVVSLIEEFQMKNPIIFHNSSSFSNFQLLKRLFHSKHYSQVVKNFTEQSLKTYCKLDVPIITFFEDFVTHLEEDVCWSSSVIVINEENELDYAIQTIEVMIDKKYLFLIHTTNEVYEAYRINNITIKQKLGHLRQSDGSFVWREDIENDFIKRRSDFHGITLKAMTEVSGNEIAFDSRYLQDAPYFSDNETYEMTNFALGIYIDILKELQNELNFSSNIYKRKVLAWGFVYPQENGSLIATGIVGDLFYEKVDLIVAPLAILYRRALYIDYLLPITQKIMGLFIPKTLKEDFDFQTFLTPFR